VSASVAHWAEGWRLYGSETTSSGNISTG